MPAFPSGGAAVAVPPLYPDYVSNAVFVVGGNAMTFSPFSGPKGSPFDALMYPSNIVHPIPSQRVANTSDHSTGALSTGIGLALNDNVPGIQYPLFQPAVPDSVNKPLYHYQPGLTLPADSAAPDARLLAIGGGKNVVTAGAGGDWSRGTSAPVPYIAQPILGAGNGGSRDAGAGPAFTGFGMNVVANPTAAVIANGAVIEAGWVNRMGVDLLGLASALGSSTTASPAVT